MSSTLRLKPATGAALRNSATYVAVAQIKIATILHFDLGLQVVTYHSLDLCIEELARKLFLNVLGANKHSHYDTQRRCLSHGRNK